MSATPKSKSNPNTNKGMSFLLIFFPEDSTAAAATLSPSTFKAMKRINSNNSIITKTQSTFSICALLLFITLLLFTFSTFETSFPDPYIRSPRKFLSQKSVIKSTHNRIIGSNHNSFSWYSIFYRQPRNSIGIVSSFALQGMGKLYRRGTRAMSDLIVGHVTEDTNEDEFRLHLRVLHRSGLTSKADIAFIFISSSFQTRFEKVIREENGSVSKLINHYMQQNVTARCDSGSLIPNFDVNPFVKRGKSENYGETIWGKRVRVNNNNDSADVDIESARVSYGSVVGFDASELDPESALAGFVEHVPMSLRRWATYPMLLGRVRRKFKRVILLDVKNSLVLGDPFDRVKNSRLESVYLTSPKHTKHDSRKTRSHNRVNSAITIGGMRGIRHFSNAMLTEIVQVAMQQKKKSSLDESIILNQLVDNVPALKNIDLIVSPESLPNLNSPNGFNSKRNYNILRVGNSNRDIISSSIKRQLCSCEVDSFVYSDC